MKKSDGSGEIFLHKKPWIDNENSIWLASTARIVRNIEKFKFPKKLGNKQRGQIISLIEKVLPEKSFKNALMVETGVTTPLEKEYLTEHFLSSLDIHQAHGGEAFVIDDTGEFLMMLNIRNHLQLQLTDCHGELENTWSRLVGIETMLGKSLSYAFSPKYGFLTADPDESGTGLVMTVFLQPSALIHMGKIDEILDKHGNKSLSITGIQGDPSELIGDILMVRNSYTLGVTEEQIISTLRNFTTRLLVEENSARAHLRREDHPEVKDRVSRAYGILIHSYQLEALEALNAISLLKLGSDLGWLKGASTTALNALFFNCRRSHLMSQFKKEVTQEELPQKRAEFIHKALKNVTLTI